MRIIYIDSDFKCHVTNDGTMTAVETTSFDGKCDTFIEGYRFVPAGESWTREDGEVFTGEMITPWKDYAELQDIQAQYNAGRINALELENAALKEETAILTECVLELSEIVYA